MAHEPSPSRLVGEQVKSLRKSRGLSGQALADRCAALGHPELTRAVLTNIENRKEGVTIDELMALARALDVEVTDLLAPGDVGTGFGASGRQQALAEARQRRDLAKRRVAVADESFKLASDEVEIAQSRLDRHNAINMAGYFRWTEEVKEAKARLKSARDELVLARVELTEAREELEELSEPVLDRLGMTGKTSPGVVSKVQQSQIDAVKRAMAAAGVPPKALLQPQIQEAAKRMSEAIRLSPALVNLLPKVEKSEPVYNPVDTEAYPERPLEEARMKDETVEEDD